MATREAGLKFTKICKYVVNAGMPNEAVYDYISDPIWIDDETDYYIVQWRGKSGIIDRDGIVKFPFIYNTIENIIVDRKWEQCYIFIDDAGKKISVLSNPNNIFGPYYSVEVLWNTFGQLFFVVRHTKGNEQRLLRPQLQSIEGITLKDMLDGKTFFGDINLGFMYNLITISTGKKTTRYIDTPALIDKEGKLIYVATGDHEDDRCSMERYDNSENFFIITYRSTFDDPGRVYRKEFLIVSPGEGSEAKISFQPIPEKIPTRNTNGQIFWKRKDYMIP